MGALQWLGRRPQWVALAVVPMLVAALLVVRVARAEAEIDVVESVIQSLKGQIFTATNHLVPGADNGREFLLVWAGDANIADIKGSDIRDLRLDLNAVRLFNQDLVDALPSPDFLAVIDADKQSPTYGKVVNTVTLGPLLENEPHHMQYLHHKGDKVFAGGLYSDTTYVFDVSQLPLVKLSGVNTPTETPCGTIPDAYWTLSDGSAYATYMGGPDLPGPCTYTNGEVRIGNGFGGSPGSIVRIGPDGRTMSEVPAATVEAEDPARCPNYPALGPATCANPHGIQVREDLQRLVASDYAEPRNIVLDPIKPPDSNTFRDTVRIFDIADANNPRLVSVSKMPDGPRQERNPGHEEPRGIMEVTVTNLPSHKGAFASSMCGGVIYYTPDITAPNPVWREVFDDTAAAKVINPNLTEGGGCDGGGWVQTDPDDKYLYHAVIGRNPGAIDSYDQGIPKMVYSLDISKLMAAGTSTQCNIDTIAEVYAGGAEPDCPRVAGVFNLPDQTTGGPHWGALDNFERLPSGQFTETRNIRRIATSNYFVARTGIDGNHKVCMLNVTPTGQFSMDASFVDEKHGTPCVDFNRTDWPHGRAGNAKPHSELFVVRDDSLV